MSKLSIADLQILSPKTFELLIARLLEARGFRNVSQLGGTGDEGIDLRAEWLEELPTGGSRLTVWAIQCKRYAKGLSPAEIHEIFNAALEPPLDLMKAVPDFFLLAVSSNLTTNSRRKLERANANRIRYGCSFIVWDGNSIVREVCRNGEILREFFPSFVDNLVESESWQSLGVSDNSLIGSTRVVQTRSYNLPRPVQAFVQRQNYFDEVLQTLDRGYRGWGAAIDGIGGIGKTSIAIEVAHHCVRNKLFTKIIWATARVHQMVLGHSIVSAPRGESFFELEGLLDEIIRAFEYLDRKDLHSEELLALPTEEKKRIVRSMLGDQDCLLVVDNVETITDYDRIARFLENAPITTKILTTTRKQYFGRGERQVHLSPLDLNESKQLVQRLCELKGIDIDQRDIERLHGSLGGVPLAIVWSVGQFRKSRQGVDRFLRRLKDIQLTGVTESPESDVLEFCFREAYDSLTDKSKQMLKLLGLMPIPLDAACMSHLLELNSSVFEEASWEVVNTYSLAQKQTQGPDLAECFGVLPWSRYFIRAELAKDAGFKREMLNRYADYRISPPDNLGVCIFTPDNKPVVLPQGATVLDFAYEIHTDVGHHFSAATVDAKPAGHDKLLRNGELVEIVISRNNTPDASWLQHVCTKRAKKAISTWLRKPTLAIKSINLANALSLRCEMKGAGIEYTRAAFLNPTSPWAHNKLGHHLRLKGDLDKALEAYQTSLYLDPDNPFAIEGIAALHHQSNKPSEALECSLKAVHRKPDYVNALFGALRSSCVLGRYADAAGVLKQIPMDQVPRRLRVPIHLFGMIAHLGLNSADKAIEFHLNASLHECSRIVPRIRLLDQPYYGCHILYYYAIALACGNSQNYSVYLRRALGVCSLLGLRLELLADLSAFRSELMLRLQTVVARQFPTGTIDNRIEKIRKRLKLEN